MDLINKIIIEEKLKYVIHVYDLNYLTNTHNKIEMTIDDDSFLEALFLRTRGETIEFASNKED